MKTLHYAGFQPGATGFGWATCNANLVAELSKHLELVSEKIFPPDVCFMPLSDHDFNPATLARGRINLAYTFFESALGPHAAANAARYDVVFCGSTWCKERCAEAGIFNTAVLLQGVDSEIFKPQPLRQPDGTIRIFSGGKFEYRKGQDLVIAAFREFVKTHPNAHLVCSWFNPWPQLIEPAIKSAGLKFPKGGTYLSQQELFDSLLEQNGIATENFTILPQLSQTDLAREMANTDFGLFPNRCEGGTNLVLMEYLSIGRSAAANLKTGHANLRGSRIHAIAATEDENHWAVQEVSEIVDVMGMATNYDLVQLLRNRWTWEAAARTVLAEIERLTA